MAKKLFFGSLSFNTTEEGLRSACEQYGAVSSVAIIKDRMSGRSKGFGFVEMEDDAAADAVIEALNGKSLDGRNVFVSEARPQTERPDRGGFRGGSSRGGFGGGRRGGDEE
jgi:cold-inducible RNA-binding protein